LPNKPIHLTKIFHAQVAMEILNIVMDVQGRENDNKRNSQQF